MKMKFNFIFARTPPRTCLYPIHLLGIALIGITVSPASAAPGGAAPQVQGVVLDTSGAPVIGARVILRRASLGFERSVYIDASGRFTVEAPAEGDYEVSAEASGFSVSRQTLRLAAGEAKQVRLALRPGVFSEEITVIGTRVAGGPETLRRIPGAVDVLGPEVLASSRVFTVSEALRKASGVNVRDEEGLGLRPNIGIRGLNPTRSAKTLLLEDGLPLSFAPYGDNGSYYHPPIERFESVEVLKGSGQIAYGPVTVGGVINYLTPGPPGTPGGSLRLSGGNRDYLNAHAQGGGTWGRTGLLVDLMHKRGDGARENVHSTLNDLNLKVLFTPSGRQTLTLKGNFYGEDSQVTYSGLREDEYRANPRQNPFANDAFTGRRLGASLKHTLLSGADVLLTTQVYGSWFGRDWWRQSSQSNQRPNDAADPRCGGMANLDSTCGNEGRLRDYQHWGVEPRLRFPHHLLGAASEAEMGLRAHFETQERRQENGETPTARSGLRVEDNRRENQAFSAFLQNRVLLGRLTLTPGLRVERIRYERLNRLGRGGAGVSGQTALTEWIGGFGLAWAAREKLSLFGGVHRGFAPPRTEDVISNATGGTIELEPERSWNFEVGARSRPRPGLRLDATFFRMDYENQVVPASLAGGLGAALTNGGETLHQGLEMGAQLDTGTLLGSAHNLTLRAAFTALPVARFEGTRRSSVPDFSHVGVNGNRLPYAPERLLTAALGYSHPAGPSLQMETVHVSAQFGDDLNTVSPSPDGQRGLVPAHTVWNATFNYEVRRLRGSVFLAVKNVFDRTYVVDRSRGILPGTPRLVQAGLTARF